MNARWIALAVVWSVTAHAAPALVAHDAGAYSLSVPKGWTVVDNAAQGMVIAQQDPKKKDAAQLVVIVSANAQGTADQLLDAILKSGLTDAKEKKRDALPDHAGKLLIADGKVDGTAARLGAMAVVSGNAAVVVVLVAKAGEFDALGGTDTLVAVLASLKVGGATPPSPNLGARDPVMTPTLSYGSLVIPEPARQIELVDLVGTWDTNNGAARAYASANGRGTAISGTESSEQWLIDARGNVKSYWKSARINTEGPYAGVHGTEQTSSGTVAVSNNQLVVHYPAQNGNQVKDERYIIDGWFVGPEVTILELQGPFWTPITADNLAHVRNNRCCMDRELVIQRKHP